MKLTPSALLCLLDESEQIIAPIEALKYLGKKLPDADWVGQAKAEWTPETKWLDLASLATNSGSLLVSLLPLIKAVL